uniref:ATP synthase complex subunit 8 n=1 Tax=Staphylinidae sp. BMNH 1274241 TaxID=1796568 RepID=A0A126TDM9_9COLE|nr:ATP synthase F0 subunit 8 [Staphylinidae sp. BMNH 1274241]
MPQMAPLNWLSLFFFITVIFLIFNALNYFSFLYQPQSLSFKDKKTKISWKW